MCTKYASTVFTATETSWYQTLPASCWCPLVFLTNHLTELLSTTHVLQAENPKQQYLLLRALNEVITSLTADTSLPERQQDEVGFIWSLARLPPHSHHDC